MAKVTILRDDIDGTVADDVASRTFFDRAGIAYEIDLTDENAAKMYKAIDRVLATYVAKGSIVKKTAKRSGGSSRELSTAIREWVKAERPDLAEKMSERGRIPAEIAEAYAEAHNEAGK